MKSFEMKKSEPYYSTHAAHQTIAEPLGYNTSYKQKFFDPKD
jgi:hypothetical protein